MRIWQRLPVLVTLLIGCATAQPARPAPHTEPEYAASLDTLRARIGDRDFGWIYDTVPLLRFEPLPAYHALRHLVEQCSGLRRPGWPTLYVAGLAVLPRVDGNAYALYVEASKAVVFAAGQEGKSDIVMHELLHWLNAPNVRPGPDGESVRARELRLHPPMLFVARCGKLVTP